MNKHQRRYLNIDGNGRIDFAKTFGVGKADDRRLDVNNLSDEQLDRLIDELDDEITYDDDGNRVRRSDLDKRKGNKPMQKITDIPRVCKGIADQGRTSISEADMPEILISFSWATLARK